MLVSGTVFGENRREFFFGEKPYWSESLRDDSIMGI